MKKAIKPQVTLPKDWGKVKVNTTEPLWKKMVKEKIEENQELQFRAFPTKSFDAVLQPIVDICIEEIENILANWARTR